MSSILDGIEHAAASTAELAVGYGSGEAVQAILLPGSTLLQRQAFRVLPSVPDDMATLARLRLLELLDADLAADAARDTGYDRTPFDRATAALVSVPGGGEILELLRRQHLDSAGAQQALLRGGLDPRYLDQYLKLERQLLSVADLAMARQQEFIDDAELHRRAALVGFDADDADLYYRLAGLPPGIGEGLELLRRGKITPARFAEYVAEGHTKTKYTDDLLNLVRVPLSASVAAEALIRQRITQEKALEIAAENGIAEDDFLLWSNMLGRPIATGEAYTAINRGLVGEPGSAESRDWFTEVVARSDVRTEYAPVLYELRVKYPPLFQVQRALQNNTITPELARDTLTKEGYTAAWVDAIVEANAAGGKTKRKQVAASIIETLYDAGLETHPEAVNALTELGYLAHDADQLTRLWLARRIVAEQVRGVSLVRGRYTGWKIDRLAAQADLSALLDDRSTVDRLLKMWDAEREANAPVLTTGEIKQAFKYGRFDYDQAHAALQRLGWSEQDALTHLWIEAHGDPRPAPPAQQPAV